MDSANLRSTIKRLLHNLPAHRKRQLPLLAILMLLGACAELLSLGAVIPFIAMLADPARVATLAPVARAMELTGLTVPQLPIAISLLFGGLVLLAAGIRLTLLWSTIRFSSAMGAEIAAKLYALMLQRPYTFHQSHNSSELIGSAKKVQHLVGHYVLPLLTGVSAVVLALSIVLTLVVIDPVVAIGGAGVFGASYFLIAGLVRKKLRRDGQVVAHTASARIQAMQEGLGGIRDVILDRAQPIYSRRFDEVESKFRAASARIQFLSSFPRLAIEAIGLLLISGFAVGYGSAGKDFSTLLPVLGALAIGAQRLMPLAQQIYNGWSSVVSSQPSVNHVLDMLDFEPVPMAEGTSISFTEEIRLQDVTFRYDVAGEEAPVLCGVDLTVRRGETIGIIGPTGSGKSTLVDLMMGLLCPTTGRFLVDGTEITPSNAAAWQEHIAHVPQAIFLSDTSIAENIAFGVDAARIDRARLERAARAAQIHDFVRTLPEGYETRVGERGVRLSGGQRQRIGIARALYKKADVLVLDEATSALDQETERKVMHALSELSSDLTVIMIAHRLTTLESCDRIIRLQQGRIQRVTDYAELGMEAEEATQTLP